MAGFRALCIPVLLILLLMLAAPAWAGGRAVFIVENPANYSDAFYDELRSLAVAAAVAGAPGCTPGEATGALRYSLTVDDVWIQARVYFYERAVVVATSHGYYLYRQLEEAPASGASSPLDPVAVARALQRAYRSYLEERGAALGASVAPEAATRYRLLLNGTEVWYPVVLEPGGESCPPVREARGWAPTGTRAEPLGRITWSREPPRRILLAPHGDTTAGVTLYPHIELTNKTMIFIDSRGHVKKLPKGITYWPDGPNYNYMIQVARNTHRVQQLLKTGAALITTALILAAIILHAKKRKRQQEGIIY